MAGQLPLAQTPQPRKETSFSCICSLTLFPYNPVTLRVSTSSLQHPPSRLTLFLSLVLTARNAWIQADVNRFGGANKCILWNAFASRGLGVNAANHNDDSSVPSGC